MKCPRCDGTELSSAGGDGSYYYYRCKKCDPEKKGKPFRAPKPLPSYNRAKTAPAVPGAPEAAPAGKAGPKVVTQREPSERRDMFGRLVTAAPARKRKAAPADGGGATRGGAEPETVQQVRSTCHEGALTVTLTLTPTLSLSRCAISTTRASRTR